MSEQSRLRIHAQITPEHSASAESRPIRWRSIPHPKQRRRGNPENAPAEKKPMTFGDRMLRNSALACALLLAILAMGNIGPAVGQARLGNRAARADHAHRP